MLNKLLGSGIHHQDPEVRAEATGRLEPQDPALAQLATTDTHASVRSAALGRCADLDLLEKQARSDSDAQARGIAAARLRDLLSGLTEEAPELERRLDFLRSHPKNVHMRYLAGAAREPEVRALALDELHDEAALVEIAIHDASAELRLQALDKVAGEEGLAKIAREARQRDKRVARVARERADAISGARQQEDEQRHLCAELEMLAAGKASPTAQARFQRLTEAWDKASPAPEKDLNARFVAARDRFRASIEKGARRDNQRRAALTRLHALQARITADEQRALPEEEINTELANALAAWAAVVARHGDTPEELRELERSIATLRDQHHQDRERAAAMQAVIGSIEQLTRRRKRIDEQRFEPLVKRWSALQAPQAEVLAGPLQQRYNDLVEKAGQRIAAQQSEASSMLEQARTHLEAGEKALKDGATTEADKSFHAAAELLSASFLPRNAAAKLRERLRDVAPQLSELQGWKTWGTDRVREGLCENAEKLAALQLSPPKLAEQVRKLRDEWKALDKKGSGASRAVWKRFDTACSAAYEPCKAFFAEQASQRAENLARKEALLAELEEIAAAVEAGGDGLRDCDKRLQKVSRDWRSAGPVDRRKSRKVDAARTAVVTRIEAIIKPARLQERERRQALIEKVSALNESGDVRAATVAAREAQREWAPRLPLRRREEQKLWLKFRAVCDQAFGLQKADQAAQDKARKEQQSAREALCVSLEQAVRGLDEKAKDGSATATDGETLRASVRELEEQWRAAEGGGRDPLQRRFQAAVKQSRAVISAAKRAESLRAHRGLCERAALCARVETAVGSADVADVLSSVRAEWAACAEAPGQDQPMLEERFSTACAAAEGNAAATGLIRKQFAAAQEQRLALCMQFEIAAGVPSPAEFEKERMAYRVQRLSQSFGAAGKNDGAEEDAASLERKWAHSGPLAGPEGLALEQRFQSARKAATSA